ncbi:hypothetical protein QFC20_002153 [Naganishia adeliensis]|uniref:Uncharacterized protein n=1 Tax=Naganishia adeliensis TaxID=92952 RepID=A0ACC2WM42_9TREE|nr:hypothetical protein QFC20_002153 [Naganishia adeliensis]
MPQLFRRSGSKKDMSSIALGTPANLGNRDVADATRSDLSDQGGSRASSLLVVNNDTQTAVNGQDGTEGHSQSPKRRPSLGHKARSKLSTIFRKDSSSRSTSDWRSRSSASPAPSIISALKDSNDTAPSPKSTVSKPPQARSGGYATPTKSTRKEVPSEDVSPVVEPSLQSNTPSIFENVDGAPQISNKEDVLPPPVSSVAAVPMQFPAVITEEPTNIEKEESPVTVTSGMPSRERSMSIDSDGEVYATPLDGLSEVEEEEEEEDADDFEEQPTLSKLSAKSPVHSTSNVGQNNSTMQLPAHDSGISRSNSSHKVRRAAVESVDVVRAPRAKHANVVPMSMEQQAECLDSDIVKCQEIIYLFLTSRMREAEAKALAADPEGQHMYIGNASCVIQAIKSMMTFDIEDLKAALEIARTTSALAHSLRKSAGGVTSRLAGMVRSGTQIAHIKSMNKVQKHAELIYAETLLIKAVLGIVAGGDWVGLVKEALNMRTAYGIYRSLQVYLETYADDRELDEHFKSGVQLGAGLSSLMLSLLPSKVMKVAELFGYGGDRKVALDTLQSAGGWRSDQSQPSVSAEQEGVRRAICDMALLTFHLVISALMYVAAVDVPSYAPDEAPFLLSRPISGVDIPLAKTILDWNMKRQVPLTAAIVLRLIDNLPPTDIQTSRFYTVTSQTEKACGILQDALDLKLEYLQLQHICLWDMGVNNLIMCNFRKARNCFEILASESSWSKAVYMYCEAACLAEMQSNGEHVEGQTALNAMMAEVPKNLKKIAGKSLPIEHEEALITEEDRKSYPSTAVAAGEEAMSSFRHVLEHAIDIQLDHWIIYFTHFEMGRLYSQMGDNDSARLQVELVMSGKTLEVNTQARNQGKYSMESALMIRVHAGLQAIKEDPRTRIH